MKEILTIAVIGLLFICGLGSQGFSKTTIVQQIRTPLFYW